ncbi:MAG: hydroxyacid dehydrogenase [Phycisphaerae bacterium]|nr:hydroxyacid dehydrogenase [Phycisphaerae bacterium]
MKKICFYEAFEEEAEALKFYLGDHVDAMFTDRTIQESGHTDLPAALISTRTQSVFPDAWAGSLAGILTRSTGYDHILAYRERTGVPVPAGYLPLYCHRAVAEQAMLLWMALLRKLSVQQRQFHTFRRDGLTGQECQAKRLLVVGVGNIGSEVCRIGTGLDMVVRGVDLDPRYEGVTYCEIDEGLPWADIVVCAMNLTEINRGYFCYERLLQARPGVVFVNVARGELSPTTGLLRLMEEGHLSGLGLDAYDHESALAVALRTGRPSEDEQVAAALALAKRDHVIFTPHNAFNTVEAVARKSEQSIQQMRHFLERGEFLWPVP